MEGITDKLARYISMLLGNHMTRRQLIQIKRSLREKQKQAQEKKAREQRQLKQAREKQQTKRKRKKVAQHLKQELRRRAQQRDRISNHEFVTGASAKESGTDSPNNLYNELSTKDQAFLPPYKVKFKNYDDRTLLDGFRKALDSNDLKYITQIFNQGYKKYLCELNERYKYEGSNVPRFLVQFFYIPNNMNDEDFNWDQRLFEIFRKHPDKFFIKIDTIAAELFKRGFLFPRSVFTDDSQPTLDHLFDNDLARNKLVLIGDTLQKYDQEANTLDEISDPIPDFIASDTDLGISRRNRVIQHIPGQHLTIPSTDDQNNAA